MDLARFATSEAKRAATTPDYVSAVLREAILGGAAPANDYLRQDQIAEQLGVSKIPVREALRSLQAEGLVTFLPNRGVVVASLSAEESDEIAELRAALETLALRHAVPKLATRDLRRAAAFVDELDAAQTPQEQSALNWDFHACLYRPADRPLLLDTIRGLHVRVDRYMRVVLADLNHREQSQRDHRALLDACAARDARGAVAVLRGHILAASRRLSTYLQEPGQSASTRR